MAAPNKKIHQRRLHLNLLYPQGVPQQLYVRFIKWLLVYGQYIVMGVLLIVILAFVARFKLDSDLSDLNQKIKNQVPFIDSLQDDELIIRRAQAKLAFTKKTLASDPDWHKVMTSFSQAMPQGVSLTTLNIDKDTDGNWQFRLTGKALLNNDLGLMLNGLKKSPTLKNTNLTGLSIDDKGAIIFSVIGGVQLK